MLPATLLSAVMVLGLEGVPASKPAPAVLQGMWKLISIERNGMVRPSSDTPPRWIIKGNKVYYGGEELAVLTVDPEATPSCIDLGFHRPKATYEGIYAIDGKTLKICVNRDVAGIKERPQAFDTKDKPNMRVLVFEREEPREGVEYEGVIPYIGVRFRADKDKGLVVTGTDEESNGARAGLRKDDVLLKIGDTETRDIVGVFRIILASKPGSELSLTIKREDKEERLKVKVGVLPFRL